MSNFLILMVASLAGSILQTAKIDRDVSIVDPANRCDPAVGATVMTWIEVHQEGQEIQRSRSVCHDRPNEQMDAASLSGAQR